MQRADAAVARLAACQYGVVAHRQLVELGLGRRAIQQRVAHGHLLRLHRGVYAVGHSCLAVEGRWMAAVLASGTGAVLSHRSAAMLWGIRRTDRTAIEVTTPKPVPRLPAVERHSAALPRDEVTLHRGIPVTTVPRTLLDLAAVLDARQLKRAVEETEVLASATG